MKKHFRLCFTYSLMLILLVGTFCSCGKKNNSTTDSLTSVTLNEVAHSIFYAPMYVAIEEGYFEEEGLDVVISNGSGADNVMTALLTNEADIGLMGCEANIYVYLQGKKDYPNH